MTASAWTGGQPLVPVGQYSLFAAVPRRGAIIAKRPPPTSLRTRARVAGAAALHSPARRPQNSPYAPVAQLDRVQASEAWGRGFESRRARHPLLPLSACRGTGTGGGPGRRIVRPRLPLPVGLGHHGDDASEIPRSAAIRANARPEAAFPDRAPSFPASMTAPGRHDPSPPGQAARDLHELGVLLDSPARIIAIETHEENRVLALLVQCAVRRQQPAFRWTLTDGLERIDVEVARGNRLSDPGAALAEIRRTAQPGIYMLMDFHPFLDEPLQVRQLKDIALDRKLAHTIAIIGHAVTVPPELARLSVRLELSVPDREEIERLVREEAQAWVRERGPERVTTDRGSLDRLVEHLLGLPADDVRRLTRRAIADDGAISAADLPAIQKEKFRLLSSEGVLTFEHDAARFADIGGLAGLKAWLEVRREAFLAAAGQGPDDRPKGLLLLGVQGCGKSLAAKAVAGAWGVPLLRLDFGSLYDKFYGESERNLRDSLRTAAAMAPCVLWIDEIEKGVSADASDGGTSRRVFGSFLTWLAENRERVFVVATANDISALPPELVRKGRMDEIFFVDLPDAAEREAVLRVHLRRRRLDPDGVDLAALVAATDGFSGAELEQVVVSGLYCARAQGIAAGSAHLLAEAARTRPLAVVMAEPIARLRAWAQGRTVPAR